MPPSKILIVEDESDVLSIMRGLIRELIDGYDIITVGSGAEALACVENESVALVLTDYHMPGVNGLDLARGIKVRRPDVKVMMITAYPSADLEQRARAVGVDEFLSKPFALERLTSLLWRLLNIGGQ